MPPERRRRSVFGGDGRVIMLGLR